MSLCDSGDAGQVSVGQVRQEPGRCHVLKQTHTQNQRERERERLLELTENNETRYGSEQVQKTTWIVLVLKMEVWINVGKITDLYDNDKHYAGFSSLSVRLYYLFCFVLVFYF